MAEIVVTEFLDVRECARAHGLSNVDAFAILPIGFEDGLSRELIIDQEATTIRKLLLQAGLGVQVLGTAEHKRTSVRKSADLVLPILFVGASVWSQNPVAVQLAMDVISSYVTDYLKGLAPSKSVKLSIAVESTRKKTTKLLTYEGPPEGIGTLASVIKKVANEQ